jgi:peptidyl-prolyl cis-trans isomerase D
MFDAVRSNRRVVQVILAVITLSFALFGVESYLSNVDRDLDVATVGGDSISRSEFDRALRDQQDRIRSSAVGTVDEAMFRSPEFRQAVLKNLINQRVLALHAAALHMAVDDRQLRETIAAIPAFQNGARFDSARYESVLRAQGLNQPQFEARMRQDLAIRQLLDPVAEGALASHQAATGLLHAQSEQREVRFREFHPAAFLGKVSITEDAIKEFFEANPSMFQRPVRIRAEYVALDSAVAERETQVSDSEVRQWYDTHRDKYVTPEERRASHILIRLSSDAPEADVAAAKARIEGLLGMLREEPSSFGRLAKEASQDPGSSANEGDLGFFGRGTMVKPFEDAVFALGNAGELAGPVRSDFGFHIIKLTDIRPSRARAFEEVAHEIRGELRKQGASRRFAEMAEAFSNMVYEQPDGLAPVADRFKLRVEQSDWLTKGSDALGNFKSAKLLAALFAEESLGRRHNTEAIDVGGTLVAARVVAHEPARRLSLEEASKQIADQLRVREAARLAELEGRSILDALKKGESVAGDWSPPLTLQRGSEVPRELVKVVFGVPSDKLPSYAGTPIQTGGFAIVKAEKVIRGEVRPDDPRLLAVQGQYQQLLGRFELGGYLAHLRERYGVEISPTAVKDSAE